MFMLCNNFGDIEGMLEARKSKYKSNGLNIQPIIVVIGPELTSVTAFFVYFEDIRYKLPTFLKCLDCVFKMFNVLNLEYPKESTLVYNFIQKHFFDISTNSDVITPNIINLLANLKLS